MSLVSVISHPPSLVPLSVDPAVQFTLRIALSLLFAWAGGHKVRDVAGFRSALASYELLPAGWIGPCTVGLIAMEISVAIGLWLPGCAVIVGLAAAGLFALYALAIVINLVRGRRDIDCGCAGVAGDQPLSGGLVSRNAVLVIVALVITLPAVPRPLTWLDAITISAGVSVLALLYAAVDGLLANAPKIAALAGDRVARRATRLPHEGRHA